MFSKTREKIVNQMTEPIEHAVITAIVVSVMLSVVVGMILALMIPSPKGVHNAV